MLNYVIQDGWREPGWSKAAKKVLSPGIGGGGGNFVAARFAAP